jgi:hypothetical protein
LLQFSWQNGLWRYCNSYSSEKDSKIVNDWKRWSCRRWRRLHIIRSVKSEHKVKANFGTSGKMKKRIWF